MCIDDYFVLSIGDGPNSDLAEDLYNRSQSCYAAEGLLGSTSKDIRGAEQGTLVGAEFVAGERWRREGFVTVGAPRGRRGGLQLLSH